MLLKKEAVWYSMVAIISLFSVFFVYNLWNYDFNVPLKYDSGDVVGMLTYIKNFIQGGWVFEFEKIAAPYGSLRYALPLDGFIHHVLLKIMTLFIKNVGYVINGYYIGCFVLISVSCYYVLRKLKITNIVALVGSVLYSVLPYHFFRNVTHLSLGAYYGVPLACLAIIYILRGELCGEKYQSKIKLNSREMFLSMYNKKMLTAIIFSMFIASTSMYYGIFFCIVTLYAALYPALAEKKWRYFIQGLVNIIASATIVIISYLPALIDKFVNPGAVLFGNVSGRVMGDIEYYGLKIAHLLLPIANHRIPAFSHFRSIYDSNFPHLNNENIGASLGLFISLGFVISILCVFFKNIFKQCTEELKMYGLLNLFIVTVATIGGLAVFIGYFSSSIRCYNRMSIFIAMFSLIAICIFINSILDKIINNKFKIISNLFLVVVLIFGILDQTTVGLSDEGRGYMADLYYSDKEFVNSIEKLEGENANIFELPICAGTYIDQFTNGIAGGYASFRPYIHSVSSGWSANDVVGGKTDRLMLKISQLPIYGIVNAASAMDFAGIAVYPYGYGEEWESVKSEIENILGEAEIISPLSDWYYYSLGDYKMNMKNTLNDHKFELVFGEGFYAPEEWGRWCEDTGVISIFNFSDSVQEAVLEVDISTGYEQKSNLTIQMQSLDKVKYNVNSGTNLIKINLKLEPGINDIVFSSDTLKVEAPGDPRNLYFNIKKYSIN